MAAHIEHQSIPYNGRFSTFVSASALIQQQGLAPTVLILSKKKIIAMIIIVNKDKNRYLLLFEHTKLFNVNKRILFK